MNAPQQQQGQHQEQEQEQELAPEIVLALFEALTYDALLEGVFLFLHGAVCAGMRCAGP